MEEPNTETLTLYPLKSKIFTAILLSILFCAASIWMIERGENFGWAGLIFFGLGFVVSLLMLLPNVAHFKLTAEGFETKSLFKRHFTKWNEVETFYAVSYNRQKMVAFNYLPAYQSRAKRFSRDLTSYDGAVAANYGKSAEEMAQMMNEWQFLHSLKIQP